MRNSIRRLIFDDKEIIIRSLSQDDIKNVRKFQSFINSLAKEDVKISSNEKMSLKKETDWLKGHLEKIKKKKSVSLVAEYKGKIVAKTGIELNKGKKEHVGGLGISILKEFRGIGLGKHLMNEIIKMAKAELKPKPRVIRLSVFATNKPAINLYKKCGFLKVASIPKQFYHKRRLIDEDIMLLWI